MEVLYTSGILGTGSCLPERIVTNVELQQVVETTDEWIQKRTGIAERRVIDDAMPAAELGEVAGANAILNAGIEASEIDLILVATITPDYLTPSMACVLQARLGAKNASAMDLNAACTGFLYALDVAKQYIASGSARYVLVVAVDCLSRITDWKDRKTCVLFGDGAGAAVLGRTDGDSGIMASVTGANGDMGHVLTCPAFHMTDMDKAVRRVGMKQVLWMDGSEVFAFASRIMSDAVKLITEKAGCTLADLDWIVPHQANMRILQNAQKRLMVPMEKIYSNLKYTGNMSAASIPVCLDEMKEKGLLKKGDLVAMVAFGGGLTWASAIARW